MKRVKFILLLAIALFSGCSQDSAYVAIRGHAQGGLYEVKLCAKNATQTPEELKFAIDSILVRIDGSASGYNKASLLSRFNAGEDIEPDSILVQLYRRSREAWHLTNGAVDVAAGPIFDIWGFGFTEGSLPSDELVETTRKSCGMALLPESAEEMFRAVREGSCPRPRLNFNCIAQGYSCDLIAEYLHSCGVSDMMINVGGEIYCDGVNPNGKAWSVGIDKPVDGNAVIGQQIQCIYQAEDVPCGIVTSGNYRKFYVKDGKKYSHSIDPRTGYPVSHTLLSATIIAPDATLADALATYCMVAGLDEASAFILAAPELEGCLIYDSGDAEGDAEGDASSAADGAASGFAVWTSPGFTLIDAQ